MPFLPVLIVLGLGVLLTWIALVAFRGSFISTPPAGEARPSGTAEQALERLAELRSLDDATVAPEAHSRLIPAPALSDVTIVLWHGFTNCPTQFGPVAEQIAARGYNVLLPRMPRHGLADVLNRDLLELTEDELVGHANTVIDIAAGLGREVWVVGLSAGGVLAAWSAALRPEVQRVVLSAPFVAPKAIPMPVVRLLIRLRRLVPNLYFWWDPRKKENLGESPFVYPGFPLPGMVPFLHLAEAFFDRHLTPVNRPRRATLVTNPGDFAIRRDVARTFFERTFSECAENHFEVTLDAELGWWHDFVDPWGPHVGSAEQVAEVFLSALGVASDPTAGGAIAEPVPDPDPYERTAAA